MNVKIKVLTAGVLFFIGGQAVMAQKIKKDKENAREKQKRGGGRVESGSYQLLCSQEDTCAPNNDLLTCRILEMAIPYLIFL